MNTWKCAANFTSNFYLEGFQGHMRSPAHAFSSAPVQRWIFIFQLYFVRLRNVLGEILLWPSERVGAGVARSQSSIIAWTTNNDFVWKACKIQSATSIWIAKSSAKYTNREHFYEYLNWLLGSKVLLPKTFCHQLRLSLTRLLNIKTCKAQVKTAEFLIVPIIFWHAVDQAASYAFGRSCRLGLHHQVFNLLRRTHATLSNCMRYTRTCMKAIWKKYYGRLGWLQSNLSLSYRKIWS